jgi:hypothetical protein
MADKPAPKLPGSTEIVEFDAQDRAIFRTYSQPLPKENPDG